MKKKILVVGQTPPPYGGQAMMIKYMLDGTYSNMELFHVRMCFSREFNDRGKINLYKLTHLCTIIYNVWRLRFKHNIHSLYYPISSSPKVALLRDVIILGCTRFLFKKTIYHFHAAGISEELPKYNTLIKNMCYEILKLPTLGITSSEYNPKDSEYLRSLQTKIIPLGIPDLNKGEARLKYGATPYLTVMFLGLLNSTKGEGYILDAVNAINKTNRDVRFIFAGRFETAEYEKYFWAKVKEYKLEDKVDYRGIVTGDAKSQMFLEADVFCFPSFFSSESFGIVLLEGMMYQMPLIASRWRGIQSVIENRKNGYIVDIKNHSQITEALMELYDDRKKLASMAKESRRMFTEKYEVSKYLHNMELAMTNI